jgi:hypothetical protein
LLRKFRQKIKAYNQHRKDSRYWHEKIAGLLTGRENMPDDYAQEIKDFYKQYGLKVSNAWHKRYLDVLHMRDVRFIPEDLFYVDIEPRLNNLIYLDGIDDKNMYDLLFKADGVSLPETVVRNINGHWLDGNYKLLDLAAAIKLCLSEEKLIIKKAVNSGGGKNIRVLREDEITSENLQTTFSQLGENLVIQKLLEQHKLLNEINPSSVNTIRIITIILHNEVLVVQSILRMGVGTSYVDNICAGGMAVGITAKGTLKEYAYDAQTKKQPKHLTTGFLFKDISIPYYQNVESIAKDMHKRFAQFRLISWDFAIADKGPVLIEFNLKYQGMDHFQMFNEGPFFGELTDEVLTELFGKKNNQRGYNE